MADFWIMGQRSEKRLATALIPIQIAGLGDLRQLHMTGLVLDASAHGLRILVKESISVGSLLRLEVEGSTMCGEVRHCQERTGGYALGLEILTGSVELAGLLEQEGVLRAKT